MASFIDTTPDLFFTAYFKQMLFWVKMSSMLKIGRSLVSMYMMSRGVATKPSTLPFAILRCWAPKSKLENEYKLNRA